MSKALFVEDQPETTSGTRRLLEDTGYSIVYAEDGIKALEIIDKGEDIGVIVSDVQMPNMDGIALIESLRKRKSRIPVILLTAFGKDYIIESIKKGAYWYLVKGEYSFEEIRTLIDRCFEVHELREKRRYDLIGAVATQIVHDFKTPLSTISLANQNIEILKIEATKRLTDLITKAINRMKIMMQEILDNHVFAQSVFDIRKVLLKLFFEEVKEIFSDKLEQSKINIELHIPSDLYVECDINNLKRAFENMIKNAIEAMNDGGTITISAERQSKMIIIKFSDTGKGIPEAERLRIFNQPRSFGKEGGTGLGLLIVKKIIEDVHKWRIYVELSEGKGTTFIIEIPTTNNTNS